MIKIINTMVILEEVTVTIQIVFEHVHEYIEIVPSHFATFLVKVEVDKFNSRKYTLT